MARITKATLSIKELLPAGRATIKVTCTIKFSSLDMDFMTHNLRFRLNCRIWGEDWGPDSWINPDDSLFTFESKRFPDANPTATEDVTFEATVNVSVLNEDCGTDEVYGLLTLRDNFTNRKITKKTNVVTHNF